MKTVSVAVLRKRLPSVLRWIEDGGTVELTKRGRVVAWIEPVPLAKPRKVKMPDFEARRRKIMGDDSRVYPSIVVEERSTYQW